VGGTLLEGTVKETRDTASEVLLHPGTLSSWGDQPRKNILAVAQYYGTSVVMIQQDYCGGLQLREGNREMFEKLTDSVSPFRGENMVAGPGFEPDESSAINRYQLLNIEEIRGLGNRKIG
jgi:hypothetical protein